MTIPARPLPGVAAVAALALATAAASAATPRSERVAARIAERAYARQSIAEARALRAEARVAEIAPLVPVPPPPRPATARRLARAGVPPFGPAPAVRPSGPALVGAAPPPHDTVAAKTGAPPAQPSPAAAPARPDVTPSPDGVADDGTRSVLTRAEEPVAGPAAGNPSGAAVTHPPIELLPTPQPR